MNHVLPRRWGYALGVGVLVLALSGCARHAARPPEASAGAASAPLSAGALFAPRASFTFAVFLPPGASASVLPKVTALAGERFKPLRLVDEHGQGAAPPTVRITERTTHDYPLPEGELLELSAQRLSGREQGQLAASERVVLLEFTTVPPALEAVRQANALALEVARTTGGLVWDEEVGEFFSPDAWEKRRVEGWENGEPLLANHFNERLYTSEDTEEGADFATVGLGKFGLPDLAVREVPGPLQDEVGLLINLTAQLMVEGAPVGEDGAFVVDLRALKYAPLRQRLEPGVELDALQRTRLNLVLLSPGVPGRENRLVELVFPSSLGDTPSERPYAALTELFGTQDKLVPTEHDEELLAASRRAKEVLLQRVKPRYQEGLAPGTQLYVKAPFDTSAGGTEWMWLRVTRWEGTSLQGVLESEPREVPKLKAGAHVTVEEGSLFDYLLERPDGTSEGNETERIILQRAGER